MTTDQNNRIDREKESTLADEIEQFKREKERIRSIVGRIGGVPTARDKILNIIFAAVIFICFVSSIASHGRLVLTMIEIGMILISLKIMYLLYSHSRQMHFMFWVLSSLEWRLNEIVKKISGGGNEKN